MTDTIDLFFGITLKDSRGEISLSVGKLPGRKQYALYTTFEAVSEPLAFFKTADHARLVIEFMRGMYDAKNVGTGDTRP